MHSLRLTEIWIYPIKSFGGIRLSSSRVLGKGLVHDRRWMLIDEEGQFLTQRTVPRMALFQTALTVDHLRVSFGGDSIEIPLTSAGNGKSVASHVFDDPVSVMLVDDGVDRWFSKHLERPCHLSFFPESHPRPVSEKYHRNHEQVSLADGFPFLIIGEASLADLNNRLLHPVPMNRFRPNLVFSGGLPFEEDEWNEFSVGRNRFAGVKPCGRCVMTTVDQLTGEKGSEPLATLSGYRRRGGSVYFGQNLIALDHEEISEGDVITLF